MVVVFMRLNETIDGNYSYECKLNDAVAICKKHFYTANSMRELLIR